MKRLIIQAFKFFSVSGIGWLLDFGIYFVLTSSFNLNVLVANILSSIPAITFVFLTSTRIIFRNRTQFKLHYKYVLYLSYQIVLLLCVSGLGQWLFEMAISSHLSDSVFITSNLKLIVKIAIAPITMIMNFFVMKLIAEKL